jgi:predicted metal-dependent RNase
MARGALSFRQHDVTRAVRATIATGLAVTRIEVEGGKIVIYTNDGEAHQESPLAEWRRKNGQG